MLKLVCQQTGIMHNAKDNVNLMFYLLAIYLKNKQFTPAGARLWLKEKFVLRYSLISFAFLPKFE